LKISYLQIKREKKHILDVIFVLVS